jgi:fatty acid desaturase
MQAAVFNSPGKVRRALHDDLFRVRPAIYWLDFGTSIGIAWTAFGISLWSDTPWSVLALLLSTLAFYRCLFFIHEIIHLRQGQLKMFRFAWNALCGVAFFLPDFTYLIHSAHHLTTTFSTDDDAEYVPLAYQKPLQILAPFLIFPFAPMLMMVRFLVAAPVSWIVRGQFRGWLLRHASSLKMNPKFEWKDITVEDCRAALLQEIGCLLWWALFLSIGISMAGPRVLLHWYGVAYGILTLNHARAIVAHRYNNGSGTPVTYEQQLLDSISITGFSPIASLLAPVGMRYHSLHHMFPTLPYHSMQSAHEELLRVLPPDHVYRHTFVSGLRPAFRSFFATVRTNRMEGR